MRVYMQQEIYIIYIYIYFFFFFKIYFLTVGGVFWCMQAFSS